MDADIELITRDLHGARYYWASTQQVAVAFATLFKGEVIIRQRYWMVILTH